MTVRAAFICKSVTRSEYGASVKLTAVCDKDGEYQKFFEATPAGEIEMSILNASSADQFTPGKTYFVDFTPAKED